jgi:hypothetical protein
MPGFTRRYTDDIGLASITVLSSEPRYIRGALNITEVLICFKSGRPHLMTVKWTESSRRKFSYKILENEEITEDEYRRLLKEPG